MLACQIVLEDDRRRGYIADKARDLIWRLWSDVGQPGLTTWQGWQQSAVLDLRQAALADAIFDAEPFIGRALERSRAFQATGAVESYDRVLATIGAVHPYELSARAARLLAPNRAHQLFLRPVPEAQRPAPGVVGVPSSDNLPMETRFRLADLGAPPTVSAPAGLRDARLMTLPNGLTVVLVPRPQFPSVTALLGFHGGSAALPPGVLEMVRVVEAQLHKRHPTKMEVLRADGRGFTADFVRTDRRRLSNALYSLADRLKTVAATDWQGLLARAQAPPRRRTFDRTTSRESWPRAGCWRRSTADIRTGTGSAARICWRSIRRSRRGGSRISTIRATAFSSSSATSTSTPQPGWHRAGSGAGKVRSARDA